MKAYRVADFSFIYDLCAPPCCADNGGHAIDPKARFWILLMEVFVQNRLRGALRGETQLQHSAQVVLLTETDEHGAGCGGDRLSRRRFSGNNVAERIFDEILRQIRGKRSDRRSNRRV